MKRRIFKVWRNDEYEAIIPATKRAVKEFIRDRARIGTHMGELRKVLNGYVYHTSVGVTYQFNRESADQ